MCARSTELNMQSMQSGEKRAVREGGEQVFQNVTCRGKTTGWNTSGSDFRVMHKTSIVNLAWFY